MIDRRAGRTLALLLSGLTLLFQMFLPVNRLRAADGGMPISITVLREAGSVAATIQEPTERWSALEEIVRGQIDLDPSGALDTLKAYPGLPNRFQHFASLARVYAGAGHIDETERIYAESRIGAPSSPQGRLAAVETRGYLAIAYAKAGRTDEAMQLVTQIKEQFRERPPAVTGTALAGIGTQLAEARGACFSLFPLPNPVAELSKVKWRRHDQRRSLPKRVGHGLPLAVPVALRVATAWPVLFESFRRVYRPRMDEV